MPYTLDQLRTAHQAAQAAGDDRSAQVIWQALIQQRTADDTAAGKNNYDPTEGMSTVDKLRAGVGQGMKNVLRHAGNVVGAVSDDDLEEAKRLDAALLNTGAGKVGSFIGETAALPLPMAGVTGAAARFGGKVGAGLVSGAVRRGAVEGAAQGALMADPGEGIEGAAGGAALGSLLPAAARGVSRVAKGVDATPEARALMAEGVDLTPGQMNPRGVMNRMEQAAEGTAVLGDFVQNARENAVQQFNRRFVERSMAPGTKLTSQGDYNALVDEAARSFDAAYDVAKGFPVGAKIMTNTGTDVPLSQAFDVVAKKPRLGLTPKAREDVAEQLQAELNELIQVGRRSGQGLMSDDLIGFRSIIRQGIRDEAGDTAESRARRALLKDAETKVTDALESQIDPAAAKALRETDAQYAKFAIARETAKKAKDAPGGPTPFQVSQAIAQATDGNAYARGGGLNRDLSKAARETFQSNVPRTGLTGIGRLAVPISAAMASPGVALPVLGTAAGLVGTRTGRRIAAGATAPQQRIAQALARVERLPQPARNASERYARALLAAAGNQ